MRETISRLVGEEGYVLGCMLLNGPYFSTWRGCFGDLILNMQRMRMGRISLLTRRRMVSFREHCRIPNLLNAVLSHFAAFPTNMILLFLVFRVLCFVLRANGLAITVRSKKREKILRQEWAEAQKIGVDFSGVQYEAV